jgi:hypothetical protein
MSRTTLDELKKRRLGEMTTAERTEFDTTHAAAKLALSDGGPQPGDHVSGEPQLGEPPPDIASPSELWRFGTVLHRKRLTTCESVPIRARYCT